jgi:hypothetical protein
LIDKAILGGTESIKSEDPYLYNLIKKGRLSKIGAIPTPRVKKQEKETKKEIDRRGFQNYINIETGKVYRSLNNAAKELNIDQPTLYYNIKNKGNYNDIIFPFNPEEEPMVDMGIDSDYDELNESKRFIEKIIKEETENVDSLSKGITITVKMLKRQYPFVVGWEYANPPSEYGSTIYINLEIDLQKSIEYFGMNLRKGYEKYIEKAIEDRETFAYPFSTLEYTEDFDTVEANREIEKYLKEFYKDMIPDSLKVKSNFGISYNVDDFKQLEISSYVFVK